MGIIGGLIAQSSAQNWNEGMFNRQKDFWYEQQEYNSPANQVQRLKEAGINPQLALGNIQVGQMGGSPSVPTMSPANLGSMADATGSILSLINNKNVQNKIEAETYNTQMDGFLKQIDGLTRFRDNVQKIKESMSREDKNRMDEFITGVVGTAEEQYKRALTANAASQNEINWLYYAKGLMELRFLPVQQRLEYVERLAEIAKTKAETATEKQDLRKKIQETNHEYFKSKGQEFVNKLNKKTEEFLIKDREHQPYKGLGFDGAIIGKADASEDFFK